MIALAWVLAIFMTLTLHEFSHALVARMCGDKTAEYAGRLTLNPIAHIDIWGLIALLILGFGWAKPVPYNPYNLKDPKWDSVKVALAGPASNLIFALIAAIVIRLIIAFGLVGGANLMIVFLFFIVLINLFLAIFNIIPVHPLDGSKLLFALLDNPKYAGFRQAIAVRGPQVLMALIVISIISNFNIFFFLSAPAYATCSVMLGQNCSWFFSSLFAL
ncbi:MAG: site-2 protease family protein [Patescibacteria group bacterium]